MSFATLWNHHRKALIIVASALGIGIVYLYVKHGNSASGPGNSAPSYGNIVLGTPVSTGGTTLQTSGETTPVASTTKQPPHQHGPGFPYNLPPRGPLQNPPPPPPHPVILHPRPIDPLLPNPPVHHPPINPLHHPPINPIHHPPINPVHQPPNQLHHGLIRRN